MPNEGLLTRFKERFDSAEAGTVFVSRDFADIVSMDTARRYLNRLVASGLARRVIDGVYEKPEWSQFLGKYLPADHGLVAKAIARKRNWAIAPDPNHALNQLGLSTQVPARASYVSDGPDVEYGWGGLVRVVFRHERRRDVCGLSPLTALVVQALKGLGKGRATPRDIGILRGRLPLGAWPMVLGEARGVTPWVYGLIRAICKEG